MCGVLGGHSWWTCHCEDAAAAVVAVLSTVLRAAIAVLVKQEHTDQHYPCTFHLTLALFERCVSFSDVHLWF